VSRLILEVRMPTRLLEHLEGTGDLRSPGRRKRKAHYQLSVLQHYARTAANDGEPVTYGPGPSPATDPPEVRGTLILRSRAWAIPTGDLGPEERPTLQLADGRVVRVHQIAEGPNHRYITGSFVDAPPQQRTHAA